MPFMLQSAVLVAVLGAVGAQHRCVPVGDVFNSHQVFVVTQVCAAVTVLTVMN